MNSDEADTSQPPAQSSARNGAPARRMGSVIALAVLVVMAGLAYFWYAADVARREALVAAGSEPVEIVVPPPVEVAGLAQPGGGPGDVSAALEGEVNLDDSDQRRAWCDHLTAELARLNYEFKQPLPPPVIDRIATEITRLNTQTNRHGCAPGKGPHSPTASQNNAE
jgi:hypothetical protein